MLLFLSLLFYSCLCVSNFTIPDADLMSGDVKAIYIPDLLAKYSDVDFTDIDVLYIPAGHYSYISLKGLPDRSADRPLYISNLGGQVKVGGLGHYYLAIFGGGSNWILTGRYEPDLGLGHPLYQGHGVNGDMYAESAGEYGFFIDDVFVKESNSGLAVGGSTNFTLEFIEVSRVGFAGMLVKKDNDGNATMLNVRIHDNYIHDTGSEGLYLGSTQSQPQHKIQAFIYNNRFIRTGTEAIQAAHLIDGSLVENNVALFAAIDWLDAFQPYQDNNLQINHREGVVRVRNNIVVGAASALIQCFGINVDGDTRTEDEQLIVEDNLFLGTRSLVAYVHSGFAEGVELLVANNVISTVTHNALKGIRPTGCWRHNSLILPAATYRNNSYDAADTYSLVEKVTEDEDGNAAEHSVTVEAARRTAAPLASLVDLFVEVNLPDSILSEPLGVIKWAHNASLFNNMAITYLKGAHVLYSGTLYRAEEDTTSTASEPTVDPTVWTAVGAPIDDVRLRRPWHGANGRPMGLLHSDWTVTYDDDDGGDEEGEEDGGGGGGGGGSMPDASSDEDSGSMPLYTQSTLSTLAILVMAYRL
jgi:hypothetical protein